MRKFTCGVKHNFNTGVIVEKDDRKKYTWNCTSSETQENIISNEDLEGFKTSGKVVSPLLIYE